MESKQRTPSVIARLMGLDELPPKEPVCKPYSVLSEDYLRKSASISLLLKQSYRESHSFKVNGEKEQEFIQSSKGEKANSSTTDVKKSVVRQKFMDGKHLSIDEKLRHSKEFDDVMKDTDSVEDLLLRYRHQPDSLFTDHLHDLQYGHPQSHSGNVSVFKCSNAPSSRKSEIFRRSKRATAQRNLLRSLQKLENGSDADSYDDLIDYTRQLLKSRLELKDKTSLSPSKIVVLKPNIGKAWNAASPSFSPVSQDVSQPCERKRVEFSKPMELHNQEVMKKNLVDDKEPSRHSFRLSRELANGIPGQIMSSASSPLTEVSRTETKVSEVITPSCPSFFNWKNQCQTTYLPLSRSSFAKQAKKQLSERWKMTKSLQEVGVAGRGTTLGEMLSVPYRDTRYQNLNYKLDISEPSHQLSLNDRDADLGSPLGISSKDGWHDDCAKSLTSVSTDCHFKLGESVIQGKDELRMQNFSYDSSGASDFSGNSEEEKPEPVPCIEVVKYENLSHVMDAFLGQESLTQPQEELLVPSSCAEIDPEFPMSLGEGYSPSPNSVLERPFNEENFSGSGCFQGVGADLHGLHMQLQLLKSESEETNSEGPGMIVSSDDDSGDGSVDFSEESRILEGLFRAEESRDFSYLVDVLDEAGFHMWMGIETWHSPDSPVNPSVFHTLEKKYGDQTSWEKSERTLLFDRINLGLKEILQCTDVLTWEKPLRKKLNLSQSREVVEEELWMFLVSQGKEVSKDLSEKALGMEIRWFELWYDIDLIVCEMERFLFDELADELVSIESI
ncbi:uncharacterized protein LOC130764294 [Actinidia eriantha]|uniref:uncharacterized protein LOC130764294 n=1 Tax=Actinidia eriantha TaxID=165200 RepID=UPI00258EFF22|nr:uncharacterized protein LOC130764294 [Actinidia eriantha]